MSNVIRNLERRRRQNFVESLESHLVHQATHCSLQYMIDTLPSMPGTDLFTTVHWRL